MAKKIKYINNIPTFVDEDSKDDGKLRIGGKTINELLAMGGKSKPSGNIASRIDFSDEKMGPKFKADTKPIKKITKEHVQQLASKFFKKSNMFLVINGNETISLDNINHIIDNI